MGPLYLAQNKNIVEIWVVFWPPYTIRDNLTYEANLNFTSFAIVTFIGNYMIFLLWCNTFCSCQDFLLQHDKQMHILIVGQSW